VNIQLDDKDRGDARFCAKRRLDDAKRVHAKDRFGTDSEQSHYWGALGEIAFAKAINREWTCTSRTWAARDVGRYEIRSVPPGTSAYIKAKANDPDRRAIAVVIFASEAEANVAGWITAEDVRRLGSLEDPGNRGAPAYFLYTLSDLNQVFPETAPEDVIDTTAYAPMPEVDPADFPLTRQDDGTVVAVWSTCPDCGGTYLIHAEHLTSKKHLNWMDTSQTLEGQTTIPEEPQPDVYKFDRPPARLSFGEQVICPRCKGLRRRRKGVLSDVSLDPTQGGACIRCGGIGIIPNIGPIVATDD
jgi:hypothetical protein